MKAMILAAGLGQRMRHAADPTPKPLQHLYGKALIVHQIERLVRAGITEIIINVSYKREQFMRVLGNGDAWGISIQYSIEPQLLGTAGGVIQALPYFESPFILTSADIWHDYPFELLRDKVLGDQLGYLVLVDNPEHHLDGDFCLTGQNTITLSGNHRFTYANIALLDPKLFFGCPSGPRPIREIFDKAIAEQYLIGARYTGIWWNLDTPERLHALEAQGI